MSDPIARPSRAIGRRGLILGTTATALATGIALAPSASAAAPPTGGGGDGTAAPAGGSGGNTPNSVHPDTSPITTTLASALINGYTYRSVCMYDFTPFDPNAKLTWGGSGTYSAGTGTALRASIEIPLGALVKDVEYYIFSHNSGSNFVADTYLYVPGQGTISSIGASAVVPTGASIKAARVNVSQQGPYPFGSRLLVSCPTPSTGLIQVNGARVGFTLGVATTALLPVPIRAHDLARGRQHSRGEHDQDDHALDDLRAHRCQRRARQRDRGSPTAPGVLKVYAAGAAARCRTPCTSWPAAIP